MNKILMKCDWTMLVVGSEQQSVRQLEQVAVVVGRQPLLEASKCHTKGYGVWDMWPWTRCAALFRRINNLSRRTRS